MDAGGLGQWRGRPTAKGNGKNPSDKWKRSRKGWCKVTRTSERAEDSRSVLDLRENRSSIEGFLGKATAATMSWTIEFFWKGKRCRKASQAKVEERKASSKMLELFFGISKLEVRLRARWRRLHRRRKQAQRLARSTRMNAQRWICV